MLNKKYLAYIVIGILFVILIWSSGYLTGFTDGQHAQELLCKRINQLGF